MNEIVNAYIQQAGLDKTQAQQLMQELQALDAAPVSLSGHTDIQVRGKSRNPTIVFSILHLKIYQFIIYPYRYIYIYDVIMNNDCLHVHNHSYLTCSDWHSN